MADSLPDQILVGHNDTTIRAAPHAAPAADAELHAMATE